MVYLIPFQSSFDLLMHHHLHSFPQTYCELMCLYQKACRYPFQRLFLLRSRVYSAVFRFLSKTWLLMLCMCQMFLNGNQLSSSCYCSYVHPLLPWHPYGVIHFDHYYQNYWSFALHLLQGSTYSGFFGIYPRNGQIYIV